MAGRKSEKKDLERLSNEIRRLRGIGPQGHLQLVAAEQRLATLRERIRRRKAEERQDPYEVIRAARLRPDPVVALYSGGEISQEQFQAADEIRNIWERLCQGRNLQAGSLEPVIASNGPYQGPIEKLPFTLDRAYRERWIPWANALDVLPIVTPDNRQICSISPLDIMIAVAGERQNLSDQIKKIRIRKSQGLQVVKKVFFYGLNAWISAG